MKKTITIYEGKVKRDPYGSWSDCSPGLYLDGVMIESLFNKYKGRAIKITIEEIEEE